MVFPPELTGGLVSSHLASVPQGSPLQRDISAARHALVMAGEGREETPALLSSQSCAHFTAGSGQCQHLWCCHWPGMPLSHPGRSGAGEDGQITSSWSQFLPHVVCFSWALQGQCARLCPAVVTSRSCSGARPAQGLWHCMLASSECRHPCTRVCVVLGFVRVPGGAPLPLTA